MVIKPTLEIFRRFGRRKRRNGYSVPYYQAEIGNNDGFSLIELIISISLTAILSGIVALVVNNSFRIVEQVQSRKTLVLDGVSSVNKFDRDLRYLSGNSALLVGDAAAMKFQNTMGNTVEYQLSNGGLYRRVLGQGNSRLLAKDINTAISGFKYYDRNKSELTDLPLSTQDREKVWSVELFLTLANSEQTIHYRASVFPENLKLTSPDAGQKGGLGPPPPPP